MTTLAAAVGIVCGLAYVAEFRDGRVRWVEPVVASAW